MQRKFLKKRSINRGKPGPRNPPMRHLGNPQIEFNYPAFDIFQQPWNLMHKNALVYFTRAFLCNIFIVIRYYAACIDPGFLPSKYIILKCEASEPVKVENVL